MARTLVQLAREDMQKTVDHWEEWRTRHHDFGTPAGGNALVLLVDRLVSSQIMLLRAIEEVAK